MQKTKPTRNLEDRPNIVEVVSQYLPLRKAGKEHIGLCPFHPDKTPSLSVSEQKGLFHCFGCGTSGDVIDFVMMLDGLMFSEACARLGLADEYAPKPRISAMQREAAELAAAWMAEQRRRINVLLGEVLEKIDLADEVG